MPYDPSPLFDALQSKLAASGWVTNVMIAEPNLPPVDKAAAVIFAGAAITHTTLSNASGEVRFLIRFYYDALASPRANREKEIARLALEIMDDLGGDFDLGNASVRNVDVVNLAATAGFQTIGSKMYRLVDLTVNVIVNDMIVTTA